MKVNFLVKLRISWSEYRRRIARVRDKMAERELDALLLTSGKSMFYLSHFTHLTTERPAVLLVPPDGDLVFLGPLLEADHLKHRRSWSGRF